MNLNRVELENFPSDASSEAVVWLKAVLASTLDPVVVVDAFGIIKLVGDSVERILGWKPHELIGRNVNVLMPEPHRSRHDEYLARYRCTGHSSVLGTAREFEVVRKDGALVPCEISISKVDVPGQQRPYFCGIIHDISKEKQARAELERLNASLEAKNRELEAFVFNAEKLASMGKLAASVAHEIRNPLTSLKIRLFSIRKAVGDDPRLQRKFQIVSEEMDRLERVVHNFLEFSRPPALVLQDCEIAALIEKTLVLFGHRFSEARIRFEKRVDGDLPRVRVDPEQLQQVFVNLLSNAVESMSAGGRVRFSANTEKAGDGAQVVVRIQDDGPGIPAEIRLKVFDPFFSTKEEGTGLGLCISKQIVERHGGRLTLEEQDQPGTCFAVWLPVSPSDET